MDMEAQIVAMVQLASLVILVFVSRLKCFASTHYSITVECNWKLIWLIKCFLWEGLRNIKWSIIEKSRSIVQIQAQPSNLPLSTQHLMEQSF